MKISIGIALAVLIPLAGSIMTSAPIIWPISTLIIILGLIGCCAILPRGYARLIIYYIVAATFFIVEAAFFFSYYLQDQGFNDAFFYHLRLDLLSAGISEHLTILLLIVACLVGFLFLSSTAVSWRETNKNRVWLSSIGILILGLYISPPAKALMQYVGNLSVVHSTDDLFKNFPELRNQQPSIQFTEEKRPNIVMIYAESVEQRFFDQTVFPDLLPNLSKLKSQSIDFSNVSQGVGAGWTIGGIVASQCGYPLTGAYNITGQETGNQMGMFDEFLPKATCIGDILSQDGYHLAFMGGANSKFAGKGDFLKAHGYKEILDLDVLTNQLANKSYRNDWGLYDDSLFTMAVDKFTALSDTETPFMLTLLTLDTHAPYGYPSASCNDYGSGENSFLNAVHCSDQVIGRLIHQIRESPYSDNTIIIVLSDHLAMRNTASPMLETSQQPDRLTFFANLPDGHTEVIGNSGLHYDLASTILDLVGYDTKGQMGFGTSLNEGMGYLPAKFGENEWINQQATLKAISSKLWETDVNLDKKGIKFTVTDLGLKMGGRSFNLRSDGIYEMPLSTVFIFDEKTLSLEKIVSYPLDRNLKPWDLSQQLMQFPNKLALAITRAQNLPAFVDPRFKANQWVYYCGKPGSDYCTLGPITGDFHIPFTLISELNQSASDNRVIEARKTVLDELTKKREKKQGA